MIQGKNIIRLSFVALLFGFLSTIFFYRYFLINDILVSRVVFANQQVAETYSRTILDQNPLSIEFLQQNSSQKLRSENIYIPLIKASLKFFNSIKAEQITLYNNSSVKLLSSNSKTIEDNENGELSGCKVFYTLDRFFYQSFNQEYDIQDTIYKGKNASQLIYTALISNDSNNEFVNQSIIKTYFPITNSTDFGVEGVIEIITNVTDDINKIDNITLNSLMIFFVFFIILFIIVVFITRNVQKIINKQIKMNRDLEEAKISAETESLAKTEFLANVSHELRTPLNSIIGFSEIIINNKASNRIEDKYLDYVHDINSSGRHLLEIINDILDFSKVVSDKLKVENMEIDVNKICQSSMRFVKPRADDLGVKLLELMPDHHVVIQADPKRLKQALLNLLSNSVKFTPKGGSVTVEVRTNDLYNKVMIIVKDTGIGIAQKDIQKALSVFSQIDNKLNRKYEGTGLGLPLTKKLVELMDGEFEIASEENVGTTVTISFPYKENDNSNKLAFVLMT